MRGGEQKQISTILPANIISFIINKYAWNKCNGNDGAAPYIAKFAR